MTSDIELLKAKIKLKKTKDGIFFSLNEKDLLLYFGKKRKKILEGKNG